MTKILLKILGAGPQRDLLTDASLLMTRLVFGLGTGAQVLRMTERN